MGVLIDLPVLVVPALFILGFLLSAWLAYRRRRAQVHQLTALRADRRRLAQKLLLARDRLAVRRDLGRRLKEDNERLIQAQNRLESEHAALAVSYANLQAGLDARPMPDFIVPSYDELTAAEQNPEDDWGPDSQATGLSLFETDVALPRVLRETPALDDSLLSAVPPEGSIHKVSTRLLKSTIERGTEDDSLRQQALKTLAEFEAELLADEPTQRSLSDEATDPSDISTLLADRDAEILRLREQIAPLLGLPLAISAREAERDQLARRLEEREARLLELETELQGQSRPSPISNIETAPGLIDAMNRAEFEINGIQSSPPEVSTHLDAVSIAKTQQFAEVPEQVDNLKRIRGIGPVLERMLNRLGIYQYQQIAGWTEEDVAFFDAKLHDFRGRIERDNWIDGARRQVERKRHQMTASH